jgi:hypothetical protein
MTQKEVRCPYCVVDDKFHPSSVLGKSGSIVVYSAFESQRLAELAAWLPEFAGRIKKIQRRLWDLLPVVRNHVYHPNFAGSYSIKNVLPALVPGMTYEGMEVADGTDAGLASVGIAHTRRLGSSRAGQGQEGSTGILWSRHTGDGQALRETPYRGECWL